MKKLAPLVLALTTACAPHTGNVRNSAEATNDAVADGRIAPETPVEVSKADAELITHMRSQLQLMDPRIVPGERRMPSGKVTWSVSWRGLSEPELHRVMLGDTRLCEKTGSATHLMAMRSIGEDPNVQWRTYRMCPNEELGAQSPVQTSEEADFSEIFQRFTLKK